MLYSKIKEKIKTESENFNGETNVLKINEKDFMTDKIGDIVKTFIEVLNDLNRGASLMTLMIFNRDTSKVEKFYHTNILEKNFLIMWNGVEIIFNRHSDPENVLKEYKKQLGETPGRHDLLKEIAAQTKTAASRDIATLDKIFSKIDESFKNSKTILVWLAEYVSAADNVNVGMKYRELAFENIAKKLKENGYSSKDKTMKPEDINEETYPVYIIANALDFLESGEIPPQNLLSYVKDYFEKYPTNTVNNQM